MPPILPYDDASQRAGIPAASHDNLTGGVALITGDAPAVVTDGFAIATGTGALPALTAVTFNASNEITEYDGLATSKFDGILVNPTTKTDTVAQVYLAGVFNPNRIEVPDGTTFATVRASIAIGAGRATIVLREPATQ